MSDTAKRAAAHAAAALVETGMHLGLGSGSTIRFFIEALAARIRDDGLAITAIPSSDSTETRARAAGIPLAAHIAGIDFAVDGADEVEHGTQHLLKGGGGALLREKIIAQSARRLVIIADETKQVACLGSRMALPVEVDPFAWELTAAHIAILGGAPALRAGPRTDGHHLILDCPGFGPIRDPYTLERRLHAIAGVIATGLFLMPVERVLIGLADGGVREIAR